MRDQDFVSVAIALVARLVAVLEERLPSVEVWKLDSKATASPHIYKADRDLDATFGLEITVSLLHMAADSLSRARPGIVSPEIAHISLHNPRPLSLRIYTVLAILYPALYYAYYHDYDTYIKSEEWTFVYCVGLGAIHALSFLITRWSKAAAAKLECTSVRRQRRERNPYAYALASKADSLASATLVRVIPKKDKGKGEIVQLQKKFVGQDGIISETNDKANTSAQDVVYSFVYQQDTYTYDRKR